MNTDKTRYFASLLYLEGIPESWEMKLELMDIPTVIGPSHSEDKSNVERQEHKRAHYHVIYVAADPAIIHSVHKRVQRALGNKGIAKVQVVKQSVENMYLYLAHESRDAIAKDKYKHAKRDIKLSSSFDTNRYVALDIEDKGEMLNDVYDIIGDHSSANIRELRRLVKEHGSDYNLPNMKIINSVLCSHVGLIRLYFDAVCQKRRHGQDYVDTHTGEIKE